LLLFENTVELSMLGKRRIRKFINIRKELRQADRVVFHGFVPNTKWFLMLSTCQDIFDKAIWVIWGIDLYNYKRRERSMLDRWRNKMEKRFRERLRYPVVLNEADIPIYKKEFGTQSVMCASYGFMKQRFMQMDRIIAERETQDKMQAMQDGSTQETRKALNIQVGNNGFPFNRHRQIFEKLEHILEGEHHDDIKVHVPLSYGNGTLCDNFTYVTAVQNYARKKYPNQVNLMTDMISNVEYTMHLAQMDVAVFNAPRHNALGNMLQLIYMGKKIYMTRESPLFDEFRKIGFIIHDINDLDTVTYEDLISPETGNLKHPWIYRTQCISEIFGMWDNVFSYVEGKTDYETAFKLNHKMCQ